MKNLPCLFFAASFFAFASGWEQKRKKMHKINKDYENQFPVLACKNLLIFSLNLFLILIFDSNPESQQFTAQKIKGQKFCPSGSFIRPFCKFLNACRGLFLEKIRKELKNVKMKRNSFRQAYKNFKSRNL